MWKTKIIFNLLLNLNQFGSRIAQIVQPPFASAMLWVAGHPMQSGYREGVSHEVLTKCDEIEIKKFNPSTKAGFCLVCNYCAEFECLDLKIAIFIPVSNHQNI